MPAGVGYGAKPNIAAKKPAPKKRGFGVGINADLPPGASAKPKPRKNPSVLIGSRG